MPVCVYLSRFYLKAVDGNNLILFAIWWGSYSSGFKILTVTQFLWRHVNWLIGQLISQFVKIELGIFIFLYYGVLLCADYKYAKVKKFLSILIG